VKYLIEGIDVLFLMVKKWSIKSYFWPSHSLGKTLSTPVNFGQPWSTLVKPFQTSLNVLPAMFLKLFDAFKPLSG
jgi:hypothetical protein